MDFSCAEGCRVPRSHRFARPGNVAAWLVVDRPRSGGGNPTSRKEARSGAPRLPFVERGAEVLLEGFDRRGLVFLHIEDGVELRDLQQIMDFLGEVEQLEFAALVLGSSEGADEFADA